MKRIFIFLLFLLPIHFIQSQQFDFKFQIGSDRLGIVQLVVPTGLAGDTSGNIYIPDLGEYRILCIDTSGKILKRMGSFPILNQPFDVAVDPKANVYVAQLGYVTKFNKDGNIAKQYFINPGTQDGQVNNPRGIAIHPKNGHLYVCEQGSRIQAFDTSGTFLFKFGSAGTGNGQFNSLNDIAFDTTGNVYVCDVPNKRIQVFDDAGNFLFAFGSAGTGDGQFSSPTGIHVTSNEVYVSDNINGTVQVFNLNGNFLRKFGSLGTGIDQLAGPYKLFVSKNGLVYVSNYKSYEISNLKVFKTDGTYIKTIGSYPNIDGTFYLARSVKMDGAKTLYVSESGYRIQTFDTLGNFLSTIKVAHAGYDFAVSRSGKIYIREMTGTQIFVYDKTGKQLFTFDSTATQTGLLQANAGMTIDAKGRLYVCDSQNHRVRVYDSTGTVLLTIPGFTDPYGIAVDSSYNFYVGDHTNGTITVYNKNGTFIRSFGGSSQFSMIHGMAYNSRGQLLIADHGHHKIQVWSTTGTYITSFGSFGYDPLQFNFPTFLCADVNGGIYVADQENERVQKISMMDYLVTGNLSFGKVEISSSSTKQITITNPSSTQGITFTTPILSTAFSTTWKGGTVAPGEALTMDITFNPNSASSYTGTLQMGSNWGDKTFSLSGEGIKHTQTISGIEIIPDFTYGDTYFVITNVSGGASGNPVKFTSSDNSVALIHGDTLFINGAGTATITATQSSTSLYDSAYAYTTVTVNKRTLTIAVNSISKKEGELNPAFTYSISGFANGDTITSLIGNVDIECNADINSAPGTYPITISQGTLNSQNYSFNLIDGILTVKTGTAIINSIPLGITIYPNPSKGTFAIQCNEEIVSVQIINPLGMVQEFQSPVIDTEFKGLVSVFIKTEKNTYYDKIVIE